MTKDQLKQQKIAMEQLNPNQLVKTVFPFSKGLEVYSTVFVKKGIGEWPTWFIVLYRGKVFDDFILLTICGHSSFTTRHYLKEGFNLNDYKQELSKSINENKVFYFHQNYEQIGNYNILCPLESMRLVTYLQENNVMLFEPTE